VLLKATAIKTSVIFLIAQISLDLVDVQNRQRAIAAGDDFCVARAKYIGGQSVNCPKLMLLCRNCLNAVATLPSSAFVTVASFGA
jgi:hypothetical protein